MHSHAILLLSIFLCGLCMVSSKQKYFKYLDDYNENLVNLGPYHSSHRQFKGGVTKQDSMPNVKFDRKNNVQELRTRSDVDRAKKSMGGLLFHYGAQADNCPIPDSICLQFNISHEDTDKLLTAELWVRHRGMEAGDPFGFSVWSPSKPNMRALLEPHWIKFNVAHILHQWNMDQQAPQTMILSCLGCGVNQLNSPVLTQGENRPMLRILRLNF